MPRAHVELVQRFYDAMRRRDAATALDLMTSDIEVTQSTEVPWGGTYRGHVEVQQFIGKLRDRVTTTAHIERFIDAGDHVVAIGRTEGTVNATGQSFVVPIAHIWKVKDGRLAHGRFCIDNPTMLAALGNM
jgi:uncharacterized protein